MARHIRLFLPFVHLLLDAALCIFVFLKNLFYQFHHFCRTVYFTAVGLKQIVCQKYNKYKGVYERKPFLIE